MILDSRDPENEQTLDMNMGRKSEYVFVECMTDSKHH